MDGRRNKRASALGTSAPNRDKDVGKAKEFCKVPRYLLVPQAKPVAPAWVMEAAQQLGEDHTDQEKQAAAELLRDKLDSCRQYRPYFAGALAVVLARDFADTSAPARAAAAETLRCLGPEAAPFADTLAMAFRNDRDWKVRDAAVNALAAIGDFAAKTQGEAIRDATLKDIVPDVRVSAAKVLGQLGKAAEPHVDFLVDTLLTDESQVMRLRAAEALAHLGDACVPHLVKLADAVLDEENRLGVRLAAARVVAAMSADKAAPCADKLVKALKKSNNPQQRKAAAVALGVMYEKCPSQSSEASVHTLPTENSYLRGRSTMSSLTPAPSTQEQSVQSMFSTGEMWNPAAPYTQPLLKAALEDGNLFVRHRASEALSNIGEAAEGSGEEIGKALIWGMEEGSRDWGLAMDVLDAFIEPSQARTQCVKTLTAVVGNVEEEEAIRKKAGLALRLAKNAKKNAITLGMSAHRKDRDGAGAVEVNLEDARVLREEASALRSGFRCSSAGTLRLQANALLRASRTQTDLKTAWMRSTAPEQLGRRKRRGSKQRAPAG
eukprot:TRINITY_DN11327_c0_g1_i2.p1 TRINITY_DN11327_c0_g1~~TRINITY_DN11327_c0_g1_i2.p1  ORF type:complete len:549 (-),score=127.30 TRINITY_DN11327_c0_g1_i2:202-1848(-)